MTTLIKKIAAAYMEHQAMVICGALTMNGSANVYETYDVLGR